MVLIPCPFAEQSQFPLHVVAEELFISLGLGLIKAVATIKAYSK